MRQDLLRSLFPDMPLDFRGMSCLAYSTLLDEVCILSFRSALKLWYL